jgi:hypothetical protein
MKQFPVKDALFLLLGGSLMLWISQAGFGGIFSKFPFVVLMIGYYGGKFLNYKRVKKEG